MKREFKYSSDNRNLRVRDTMTRTWENVVSELETRIRKIACQSGRQYSDELFCEVRMACFEKRHIYDWNDNRIDGRVLKIAKNLLAGMQKRDCKQAQLLADWRLRNRSEVSPEGDSRDLPNGDTLNKLLDQLPVSAKERLILRESVALERPEAEVAAQLRITPKSMRSRKSKVLKRLRSCSNISCIHVQIERRNDET